MKEHGYALCGVLHAAACQGQWAWSPLLRTLVSYVGMRKLLVAISA